MNPNSDLLLGFPGGASGKEPACQCRRCAFDPWIGKIPWRRAWQPTVLFLPGKSYGQRSLVVNSPQSCVESDMTEASQHKQIQCQTRLILLLIINLIYFLQFSSNKAYWAPLSFNETTVWKNQLHHFMAQCYKTAVRNRVLIAASRYTKLTVGNSHRTLEKLSGITFQISGKCAYKSLKSYCHTISSCSLRIKMLANIQKAMESSKEQTSLQT